VEESRVYEPDAQLMRARLFARTGEGDWEEAGTLDMRMYFPQELDALLRYSGFRIEATYGDFDRTPFGPRSRKQIVLCAVV